MTRMIANYFMEATVGEKLYGTSDLAGILGVTRQTIKNWIDDGLFPNAQRIGRSYIILSGDVVEVLRDRIHETREQLSRMESELEEINGEPD